MPHYTVNRFNLNKHLGTPLKLIGAKTKWRDVLYEFFPEHDVYIEPFLGSGAVLIGKDQAPTEIVGDINSYVINFFNILQTQPERFWKEYTHVCKVLFKHYNDETGRKWFEALKRQVTKTQVPVSKAILFYFITKMCMNGIWRLNRKGECNSSYCKQISGRGLLTEQWFNDVLTRIDTVQFVEADYKKLLATAQWEARVPRHETGPYEISLVKPLKVFVFLDPPYYEVRTRYNGSEWKKEHFEELAGMLRNVNYKWLLTINDHPFIRELFADYPKIDVGVLYSCSQTNSGRGEKRELLIANYPIQDIAKAVNEKQQKTTRKKTKAMGDILN